ncbi:TetR/AcrR family transcriptional regulator [Pseudonocardia sp. WMMC193]|uniref:TetR/AcrR family transcriptional regulator n=1 Tax=Pseudonocardia sp. WMMC193 TaxID=2911965 RepID=UPI001F3CF2CC|nr:TetR/AcrR family transcriptional regulator [Pseudonocardia sp. WMMC193]MCF7547601.1 TetR/AcrR family transcriptional regulator [Pseudonocardia sp. WMMC193]
MSAPRRADARRNHELILGVAEAEVAAHGAGASLEQIARVAGVGSATVRRHFPTRRALLEAVSRERVEALRRSAIALAEAPEPRAALLTWLDELLEYSVTARGLAPALLDGEPFADSPASSGCAVLLADAADPLLRKAVAEGAVAADVTVSELITLVVGIVLAAEHLADPGTSARRLLGLAVTGLAPAG